MTASFIARAPQIRDRLGVSLDAFGLLLTVSASVGVIGSLLAGRIIHAAGTRRMLQVGAVVMVLSLPVIGAATAPAVWLVGMFAYVFVDVFVDISMNLQGSWISARRHAPVMNRLHGLWSVGTLAGGLGAVAANAAGWSPFAHLTAVAIVMAVILLALTRRLLEHDQDDHGDQDDPEDPGDQGERGDQGDQAEWSSAARPARMATVGRAPIVLLVLAGTFAVVMEVTGGDWATFRLTDDFGATAATASAAFVAYTLGMSAMRFGGDSLQVRLGRSALHRWSVAVASVGFVVATLIPSRGVAIVGFVLVGLGVATFMPKLYDDAARVPGRRGAGLGAMTAGMRVAFLVTPVAVGGLAATSLSVGEAIAICSLPAAAGLAIVTEWNDRLLRSASRRTGADI